MRRLPHRVCSLVVALSAVGCGQDAEKKYAGLDALTVRVPSGPGYRIRYLSPPWERVSDDGLERGATALVAFGSSVRCDGTANTCREVEPKSARVLEIERTSVVQSPGTLVNPKYRLEAALLRCEPEELAPGDECADVLAHQDELGKKSAEGDDEVLFARTGANDRDQSYREIVSRGRSSLRYRRVVYFVTDQRELTLRLFFEANPNVAETEVTRMIAACEVLESDQERTVEDAGPGSGP